ncbi:hypothetical protein YC2023_075013 [Brassica napus]
MEIMYRYATNKMVHELKLKMEDLVNGDYEDQDVLEGLCRLSGFGLNSSPSSLVWVDWNLYANSVSLPEASLEVMSHSCSEDKTRDLYHVAEKGQWEISSLRVTSVVKSNCNKTNMF